MLIGKPSNSITGRNQFRYLARWQAQDPGAASCVDCHQGHATDGDPQIMFLDRATTQAVCEACHASLGEGG